MITRKSYVMADDDSAEVRTKYFSSIRITLTLTCSVMSEHRAQTALFMSPATRTVICY